MNLYVHPFARLLSRLLSQRIIHFVSFSLERYKLFNPREKKARFEMCNFVIVTLSRIVFKLDSRNDQKDGEQISQR